MLRFINCLLNETLHADFGSFLLARDNPRVHDSDDLGCTSEPKEVLPNEHIGKGQSLTQGCFDGCKPSIWKTLKLLRKLRHGVRRMLPSGKLNFGSCGHKKIRKIILNLHLFSKAHCESVI
jgi:hypothetical protein